jgi:hypothetical protein
MSIGIMIIFLCNDDMLMYIYIELEQNGIVNCDFNNGV